VATACTGQINEDNAYDEGGLDTFTESDEKSGKHENSS